jgi:acrylyl-CoA reductase (NADPH)
MASTGRLQEADYLRQLGAADVLDRAELSAPGKALAKERWAGVVDTVGSHTLANACASTQYGGVVTACGLAQGMDFPSSVAPFILRGVTLAGIDSVMAPRALREAAWARLAQDLDTVQLERMTREVGLANGIGLGAEILAGQVRGRVVVNVNA